MPYKSIQQEKYFNANRKELEAQGVNVDAWNKASKGLKLPKRVKKYAVGGDNSTDFFNQIADYVIQQQNPSQDNQDYTTPDEPTPQSDSGDNSNYDDLQGQIEDLKSQLEDVRGNYDPKFNDSHSDDEFLNFLFLGSIS